MFVFSLKYVSIMCSACQFTLSLVLDRGSILSLIPSHLLVINVSSVFILKADVVTKWNNTVY